MYKNTINQTSETEGLMQRMHKIQLFVHVRYILTDSTVSSDNIPKTEGGQIHLSRKKTTKEVNFSSVDQHQSIAGRI